MWFTLELCGVTVLRIGVGKSAEKQWVTHTEGCFELAPPIPEVEYEYEDLFGFR